MRKLSEYLPIVGLIVAVTVLTYGVLIPQLGFYRDDWYLLVTAQSKGAAGIIALFQIDRPLVGYFYALAYRLLGVVPLGWHLAALLMRLAGTLAFFCLLQMVWPRRLAFTSIVALLFGVYPGFTVEPNAGVYVTDLLANAAAICSLTLMLVAMQSRRRLAWVLLSVLAVALELTYLGIFESAIGLEAARLAVVWLLASRQPLSTWRTALARVFKITLPYLAAAASFFVWRVFIFQSTRRATNLDVILGRYASSPLRSGLAVVVELVKDAYETTILAWLVPFYQWVAKAAYRDLALAFAVAAIVVTLVFTVLRRSRGRADAIAHEDWTREPVWLGMAMAVLALIPIDLAGRNVLFADQWDRYTIYASAGVALFVAGLLFRFLERGPRETVFLGLIGMSVVVHFFSAAWYRDFWHWERDLWQQMVWRAPQIRPGTMLFVNVPFGSYQEGYEIYGPANMIYFPGQVVTLGGDVLNPATAANIQMQKNRQHYDRSELIDDNYRNTLIGVYPSQTSCLHILNGKKIELPGLLDNSLVPEVAAYSRMELIDTAAPAARLPGFLEGQSARPWCRYYQSMDLGRQRGDWGEVARLADGALARGLTPEDVSEWMPALEAYATLGRTQDMRHAASIVRSDDTARVYLCLQLQRGAAYPPPYDYNAVNDALCQSN